MNFLSRKLRSARKRFKSTYQTPGNLANSFAFQEALLLFDPGHFVMVYYNRASIVLSDRLTASIRPSRGMQQRLQIKQDVKSEGSAEVGPERK